MYLFDLPPAFYGRKNFFRLAWSCRLNIITMRGLWILIFLLPLISKAQIKLADIFSDNMVLQRDQPLHIWGKGRPGQEVSISFGGERKNSVVQKDSSWTVVLKRHQQNSKPQSLVVSGSNERLEFKNILIGDVWICLGQSNMEWPMEREKHWKAEKQNTIQPLIRLNNPPPAGRGVFGVAYSDSLHSRLTEEKFYQWTSWQNCDSNSARQMSAVGYYFAKSITEKIKVPIGIINLSIGGAPIETFINIEALQGSKEFSKKVQGNWLANSNLPVWIRERGIQNVGSYINGFGDQLGLNHAFKPGFAFESGIKPLLKFPVKGILFYQGESNAQEIERVNEYAALSALMVQDYREQWNQLKMPFYFVQLSSIDTAGYNSHLWPQFRDEQRKLLQMIPHSGMAVTSDIGAPRDVHPTNKKDVGERLARWALHYTYQQSIIPSGPLPLSAGYRNGKVTVHFDHGKGLRTADGKSLRGFSIDGRIETIANIEEELVVLLLKDKPGFIYYGWKPYSDANLVNNEGLPASTFKIKVE
jgi:sialate O-acetylesterase